MKQLLNIILITFLINTIAFSMHIRSVIKPEIESDPDKEFLKLIARNVHQCCGLFFDNYESILIHLNEFHRKEEDHCYFFCFHPGCNYKSQTQEYLLLHIPLHTGEILFRCETCNFNTNLFGKLKRHKNMHKEYIRVIRYLINSKRCLSINTVGRVVCPYCLKVFQYPPQTLKHIEEQHIKEKTSMGSYEYKKLPLSLPIKKRKRDDFEK